MAGSLIMSPSAPTLQATMLALKTVGPMTTIDLAETLGISLKTMKTRLHILKSHGMVDNRKSPGERCVTWYITSEDAVPEAIVQAPSVWDYARTCAG